LKDDDDACDWSPKSSWEILIDRLIHWQMSTLTLVMSMVKHNTVPQITF